MAINIKSILFHFHWWHCFNWQIYYAFEGYIDSNAIVKAIETKKDTKKIKHSVNDTLTKWNWASKNMYEYRRFSWKLKSVNRMTSKTHAHTQTHTLQNTHSPYNTSKCHQHRTDHFYGFKSTNNAHKKSCKSNYKIIIESWIHLLLKKEPPVNSKTQVEGNGVREPIPLTDL